MNRIQLTPVVKQLLIACFILFAGTYLLKIKGIIDLDDVLAMHFPKSALFKPWQIITHMFMHGGLWHIVFNMFALVSLGVIIERFIGSKKFLQLYFFSGLGAIFIHVISQVIQIHSITGLWFPSESILGLELHGSNIQYNTNYIHSDAEAVTVAEIYFGGVLGASGAIYGLAAAFAFLFPNTELIFLFIPYPIKAKYMIPGIVLLDIIFGFSNFSGDPVAHFAHIGGAMFGLALVYYWRKFDKSNFY